MNNLTVLILGGGIAGVVASTSLKEKVGDRANVIVVEKKSHFQFPPSYPWLMLGERKHDQVQRDLSRLKKKGIDVVQGDVRRISLAERSVQVGESSTAYDFLVIALGAQYVPERIPGLLEYSNHMYDLESTLKLQRALQDFRGGKVAVGVSSLPFKCPAAPYEAAFLIDDYLRKKGLGDKTKISFFTPEGLPLPSAGPEIGNGVMEMMKSKGFDLKFKSKLKEVKQSEAIFEDGTTTSFDLMVAVPPHKCPAPVQEAGLPDQTGWVPVDSSSMRTTHPNVYAVGDVTTVSTPLGFVPFLPKAGTFARGQAEAAAGDIASQITGGEATAFDGSGECFLMTSGSQAGFVKGNWFSSPRPDIRFQPPTVDLYHQRLEFEKFWLTHWM